MQTVAETPAFSRQTTRLFTEDEKQELIDFLGAKTLAGDVIPGAGGVRKLRFRAGGGGREQPNMSTFGNDLVQSLREALTHAKGDGSAIVHPTVTPREVREAINLTQAQMAPLVGMSLSGYRKWEQGARRVSGPAAALLQVIRKEPDAVRRALLRA